MRNHMRIAAALLASLLLAGSFQPCAADEAQAEPRIYATAVQYSGEDESAERYLEIAQRSQRLFLLLEENADAFVMNAYNYQDIDGEGTPLYTMNTLDWPVEIAPNGQSLQVSRNYFKLHPIQAADGGDPMEQLIYDDLTLNLLVPERYRALEAQITEAYRAHFYFEKVTAANDYNEMAGIEERLTLSEDELTIHIIYVKDGQDYFLYRDDCAVQTGGRITDPVVEIYTANIHCSYAHSNMSQWVYFPSDKETAEEAYQEILPYIEACGATDSFQRVRGI